MKNYLFEIVSGDYEGEKFFIQADNRFEAVRIAYDVVVDDKIHFLGIYTDEEAEMMGYDTY